MKFVIFIVINIFTQSLFSFNNQKDITFKIISKVTPDTSNIFITGNHQLLGNWIPDKVKVENHKNNTWFISLSFPEKTNLEYKFTRGGWDTEAISNNGDVPPNHLLQVKNDTIIEFIIEGWKDSFMDIGVKKILGDFKVHQKIAYTGLKSRNVIVWLPPGYTSDTEKKYPVLYMHDGQNLFDPNTSFKDIDWRVDETVDSLIRNNEIKPIIVVGIYNTGDRSEEYSNTPLGKRYTDFIINKLKPFIDSKYRTLPDRENTATGGASMGGLISFILVWDYSDVFSKAICMSPAFKVNDINYVSKVENFSGLKKNIKIYMDNGGLDLEARLQPGIDQMLNVLQSRGFVMGKDLLWFKDAAAPHNESSWGDRFWQPLKFLFNKETN